MILNSLDDPQFQKRLKTLSIAFGCGENGVCRETSLILWNKYRRTFVLEIWKNGTEYLTNSLHHIVIVCGIMRYVRATEPFGYKTDHSLRATVVVCTIMVSMNDRLWNALVTVATGDCFKYVLNTAGLTVGYTSTATSSSASEQSCPHEPVRPVTYSGIQLHKCNNLCHNNGNKLSFNAVFYFIHCNVHYFYMYFQN